MAGRSTRSLDIALELSRFERTVLERLIVGDAEEGALQEQLKSASVLNREFTGVGVFVKLAVSETAPRVKIMPERHIEERPSFVLKHPALEHDATALVFLRAGIVDTLECVTIHGDWPGDDSLFRVEDARWNMPATN